MDTSFKARISPRDCLFLSLLLLASFAIRLAAVAVTTGLHSPPVPGSDESEYDACAWNLAQGRGYKGYSPDVVDADGRLQEHPTAYRPPVPTLFFAGVYLLMGHNYAAAHIADSLLATLTILLVFQITFRVFGRSAAWVAAVLYAFYPVAIYYNLTLLSETQGAFLICLFVWSILPIKSPSGLLWAAGAGLSLGLLLLCKPGFVFMIPLLPIWGWIVFRGDRSLWLRASLIALGVVLVILPWVVRNYRELGQFIPFSTGGGSLLLQANNRIVVADADYHGYAIWDTALPEYAAALRQPNDEFRRDAVAKQLAMQWLRENPDKWFYLARGKFWRLWTPEYTGRRNRHLTWLITGYYGPILLVFVLSVLPLSAKFIQTRDPALVLLVPILATIGMAVLFHGQHRYRFPIDSLLIVFAAGGLSHIAGLVRSGRFRAALRSMFRSRRSALAFAIFGLTTLALIGAILYDNRQIHSYRSEVSRERVRAITAAVNAYRKNTGQYPAQLEELVPSYLPSVEALHCPTHSLGYADYQLLGTQDARAASQIVSYSLELVPGNPNSFRVVQTRGTPCIEGPE
jgi:4-amino-4-deoxy-L-arabinose transferase-like glycosyltransferase